MKKAALLALLVGVVSVSNLSALGIGAAFTPNFGLYNAATDPAGAALSFKLDSAPYVFGLGARGGNGVIAIGLTADLWMAKGQLVDFLNFYAGPGLFVGLAGGNNTFSMDGGIRIPVGINAFLLKNTLEFFFELAPAFGIGFGSNSFTFPTIGLQGALGFRFWFK